MGRSGAEASGGTDIRGEAIKQQLAHMGRRLEMPSKRRSEQGAPPHDAQTLRAYAELAFSRRSCVLQPELRWLHRYRAIHYASQLAARHPASPDGIAASRLIAECRFRQRMEPELSRADEWIAKGRDAYSRPDDPDHDFVMRVLAYIAQQAEPHESLCARLYLALRDIGAGKADDGFRELRHVAEQASDPEVAAQARYALAMAMVSHQRYAGALAHLEILLERYPESLYAPGARRRVKSLRSAMDKAPSLFRGVAR